MKRKKNKKILKAGFLTMFVSIVLLFLALFINSNRNLKKSLQERITIQNKQQNEQNKTEEKTHPWTNYVNEEYSVSFSYPYLLHEREYKETGEYAFFIIFEENQFSFEKGVAFGVSKDGLEKEIERVKSEISLQGNSKLTKDENFDVEGEEARTLVFEPKDESLEKRSFLIVEKGDYTYSFSTVPEQMQKLKDSIQFL